MESSLTITKAAKLAGITRQTMSKKISDAVMSKNADGKIDISELLRVYPHLKLNDTPDTDKSSDFNTTRHLEKELLEQEIKYLNQLTEDFKKCLEDMEKQLIRAEEDKADLKVILRQQTAMLPGPNKKRDVFSRILGK